MALRSLWSDERGVSMVEFGFIALPLSIIMMGGLEMGHQSYVRSLRSEAITNTQGLPLHDCD